jgi:hypothetical protein
MQGLTADMNKIIEDNVEVHSRTAKAFAICEAARVPEKNQSTEATKMETSIEEQADTEIKVVNAPLNYLAEATPKPVNYAYDPPAGVPRRSGKYVEQNVAIRNGRELLGKLSLDTNGFVLTEHETAVKDFYDPEEVKSVYYPEVERLLKRVTGAERVLIFDHTVRNAVLATRGE